MAIRVSGEAVGFFESTFKVIGYFCLQQFAFVGLHRIYHHEMCILSYDYDWPVVRLISFLHEETGKLLDVLGAPSHSTAGPGQVQ